MLQIVAQTAKGFVFTQPAKVVPNIAILFKNPAGVLDGIPSEARRNLYYTLAHHTGAERASFPQRTASTFDYQTVLPFDIDGADTTRPYDYATIFAKHLGIDPKSLIIVCSGNGFHFLANLLHPIRAAKFFKESKPYYVALCDKIAKDLGVLGLAGKLDPTCFEPARVFRLPNTINSKPDRPDKNCELIQYSDAQSNLDLPELSGLGELEKQNISPTEVRRHYPRPDFSEMVSECQFIQWAMTTPEEVHEPHAFDLFSLLSVVHPSDTIEFQGSDKTAQEVASWVFQNATASRSLARQDFDNKWEQSGKYGARKCDTINQTWGKCEGCPHFSKVPTPLALKSKEHIASEVNGFWVLDSKGRHQHPHYGDLAKVYQREHSYITTPEERLFTFNGTHYEPGSGLLVKSWLEAKVEPTDPLRTNHYNEFLHKVKVLGALSLRTQEELFEKSIRGKLNCRNGILDIAKGELTSHTPNIGFQYALDYDYEPGQASEAFLDWLSVVTEDRTELMETILDVLAYCLWPTYDDHLFVYLVGEGGNGKSTLLRIVEELVGRQNLSSVSMQQLTNNRFAPAALEGKLVNLSAESSGAAISSEQLNVVKTLSSGDTLQVERKGENGYSFRNKAKLIFSANKVPRFAETGASIKRRLIVIPFDHVIKSPDWGIEAKLVSEVPKILSMLVKRIQENLIRNHGRFVVNRGGRVTEEAQDKFLTAGSTAIEWARENLDTSVEFDEDETVEKQEAYGAYVAWCAENGYQHPDNRRKFTTILENNFVTKGTIMSDLKRVGGKVTRVFRKTKWKREEAYVESI